MTPAPSGWVRADNMDRERRGCRASGPHAWGKRAVGRAAAGLAAVGLVLAACGAARAGLWDWSLHYTHTNNAAQESGGNNRKFSLRGLALAQDGSEALYTAHILKAYKSGEGLPGDTMNILRLDASGALVSYVSVATQPKALATDDRGCVYAPAGAGLVNVYSADLGTLLATVDMQAWGVGVTDGLDVQRVGSAYYLFTTNRRTDGVAATDGLVHRHDVTDLSAPAATGWQYVLGTTDLRGIAVAPDGTVWVADKGNSLVYKIAADASGHAAAAVPAALDIAFHGACAFVSTQRGNASTVEVLSLADLAWKASLYDPAIVDTGYGCHYGLGGLDIAADGTLFAADEDSRRREGPASPLPYVCYDDRILTIHVPEPGTLALLGMGAALVFARRRGK